MQYERAGIDAHYRSMHFRVLQHERFYQGEHELKPRGSRWIQVSDSVVKGKSTPHTLIEK